MFPEKTIINKKIPKQRFYSKMDESIKKFFTNEVDSIILTNKLSTNTINLSKKGIVEEILVIKILFKNKFFEFFKTKMFEDLIKVIESSIPYTILFLLDGPKSNVLGKQDIFCISYKNKLKNNPDNCKVAKIFIKKVNDVDLDNFLVKLEDCVNSKNLEEVYEKITKLIAGEYFNINIYKKDI
jgi:hypothetical protein